MPRKTGCQHGESSIYSLGATLAIWRRHPYLGDSPTVAIPFIAFKADIFPEYQAAHPFLGPLAERLRLFRGIDSGDADLVLSLASVKHRDGIAVCNANDNTSHISKGWQ